MASTSSDSSEENSNDSDSSQNVIIPTPWTKKETPIPTASGNTFKNDGSFLELFKKMQEQNSQSSSSIDPKFKAGNSDSFKDERSNASDGKLVKSEGKIDSKSSSNTFLSSKDSSNKPVNRSVGKRRLARVLPTGLVKKQRKDGTTSPTKDLTRPEKGKNDPWSKYMDEVRRYKQQSCSEDDSTRRPLVK